MVDSFATLVDKLEPFFDYWSEKEGAYLPIQRRVEIYQVLKLIEQQKSEVVTKKDFAKILRPLVCRTKEQQENFINCFEDWIDFSSKKTENLSKKSNSDLTKNTITKTTKRDYRLISLGLLMLLFLVSFYSYFIFSQKTTPSPKAFFSNTNIVKANDINSVVINVDEWSAITKFSLQLKYDPSIISIEDIDISAPFLLYTSSDKQDSIIRFDYQQNEALPQFSDTTKFATLSFKWLSGIIDTTNLQFQKERCFLEDLNGQRYVASDASHQLLLTDAVLTRIDKLPSSSNKWPYVLALFFIVLFIYWLWWRYSAMIKSADLYLKRRQPYVDEETDSRQLFFSNTIHQISDLWNWVPDVSKLHNWAIPKGQYLNLNATVYKTSRQAGLFSPVYKPVNKYPQFLALVDRTTLSDHQADFSEAYINRLKKQNLKVELAYFDEDPRKIFFTDKNNEYPLSYIQSQYPHHHVLVFSSLRGLYSPYTGELQSWATGIKGEWDKLHLFSPENLRPDQERYKELVQLGFNVQPLTSAGMATFIAELPVTFDESLENKYSHFLPDYIIGQWDDWLSIFPPQEEDIDQLLSVLKEYLGEYGFRWLVSCAVFCEIHLELTLYLGNNLYKEDEEVDMLYHPALFSRLMQLPWMRKGYMPDWLRENLINSCKKEDKVNIQATIEDFFNQASTNEKKAAKNIDVEVPKSLKPTLRHRLFSLLRENKSEYSAFNEPIFADFMDDTLSMKVKRFLLHERTLAVEEEIEEIQIKPSLETKEQEEETLLWGHTSGLYVLFFTEMWERFSFYGMRVLLVLFLTAPLLGENPGWEFSTETAISLYGTFLMLLYLTPILGGIIADRYIGYRRAVLWGAIIMTFGHFFIAGHSLLSFYFGILLLIIGTGLFKPNITSFISEMYQDRPSKKDGAFTIFYMGVNAGALFGIMFCGYVGEEIGWSWGFGLAAAFMLLGTVQFWLAKPLFGKHGSVLFEKKELDTSHSSKEEAPNPFTVSDKILITISCVLGLGYAINDPLYSIAGIDLFYWIRLGGGAGQYIAALTAVGAFLFLVINRISRYEKIVRERMIAVAIFAVFTVFFWLSFVQGATSMVVFTRDSLDRVLSGNEAFIYNVINALLTIVPLLVLTRVMYLLYKQTNKKAYRFNLLSVIGILSLWILVFLFLYGKFTTDFIEIPVSWFSILNSFFVIVFASIFSRWWSSKYNPSGPVKYGLGFILMAVGFGLLAWGTNGAVGGVKVNLMWLVLAYLFHTLGELCMGPVGLSYVAKLVPARMVAFMFGVWYLAIAIGNKLATILGGQIENITEQYSLSSFFLVFTVIPAVAGIIIILLNPTIKKLMHGVK